MKKIFLILTVPCLFLFACGTSTNNEKADEDKKVVVVKKTFEEIFATFQAACVKPDGAKMATITHYGSEDQFFIDEAQLVEQVNLFLADPEFRDLIAKGKVADAKSSDMFGGSKEFTVSVKNEEYESSLTFYFKEYDGEYALISLQAAG